MNTRLRDIADIRSGYPFRGRVEHDPAGEIAVVSMRDIVPGRPLLKDNLLRINQVDVDNVDRHLLQDGDVIFQSRGHHNYAALVRGPIHGLAALGLYRIRPDTELVLAEYLTWYLNEERFQRRLSNIAQGTHIPFVPRAELAMMPVPIPRLEEQKRVADLHRLRERQKQLQKELDDATDKLVGALTWKLASSENT